MNDTVPAATLLPDSRNWGWRVCPTCDGMGNGPIPECIPCATCEGKTEVPTVELFDGQVVSYDGKGWSWLNGETWRPVVPDSVLALGVETSDECADVVRWFRGEVL